jgi:uncharacterized protein YndB with AHSA1/START domain
MKSILYLLLAASVFAQGPIAVNPVTVTKVPAPNKALIFEAAIPASLDDVWAAFTVSDELSKWLTPGAVVDLRNGGEWTAHFPGGGTGGGVILSFKPKAELVISAMAPPQFPHVRQDRTTATWRFSAIDANSTKVTLTQTGWKQGEEWDTAFEYLAVGNAQLIEALRQRFANPPAKP